MDKTSIFQSSKKAGVCSKELHIFDPTGAQGIEAFPTMISTQFSKTYLLYGTIFDFCLFHTFAPIKQCFPPHTFFKNVENTVRRSLRANPLVCACLPLRVHLVSKCLLWFEGKF